MQNRSTAVMASRMEPSDSPDFFPTPPWATRALCEVVLPSLGLSLAKSSVWEPACGEGHMAHVLADYAASVRLSDVHDYGTNGALVGSFVGQGLDVIAPKPLGKRGFGWIITNPPFALAEDFALRALDEADGVALLVRSVWAEGVGRFDRLFSKRKPLAIAQFSERVPMVKGRWDPSASTATSYAWFIWNASNLYLATQATRYLWIPPGQRARLTRPDDIARFANRGAA